MAIIKVDYGEIGGGTTYTFEQVNVSTAKTFHLKNGMYSVGATGTSGQYSFARGYVLDGVLTKVESSDNRFSVSYDTSTNILTVQSTLSGYQTCDIFYEVID